MEEMGDVMMAEGVRRQGGERDIIISTDTAGILYCQLAIAIAVTLQSLLATATLHYVILQASVCPGVAWMEPLCPLNYMTCSQVCWNRTLN